MPLRGAGARRGGSKSAYRLRGTRVGGGADARDQLGRGGGQLVLRHALPCDAHAPASVAVAGAAKQELLLSAAAAAAAAAAAVSPAVASA